MPFYENVFIARQDLTAAQVDTLADTFTALIKEKGGDVKKRESWGLRNLTYRIRKNRKGHYIMFNLDAPPAAIHELERTMRLNEDVIRFLTVRVDELEEGPSAVMQKRDDRGERGERGDRFGDRGGFGDRPRRRDDAPGEGVPALAALVHPWVAAAAAVTAAVTAAATAAAGSPPGGRSSGGARPARSPAPARRRSTTRTHAYCNATCRSAARSCRAASRPFPQRSSASSQKRSSAHASSACCPT